MIPTILATVLLNWYRKRRLQRRRRLARLRKIHRLNIEFISILALFWATSIPDCSILTRKVKNRKRAWIIPRNRNFFNKLLSVPESNGLREEAFIENFRMRISCFNNLVALVRPKMQKALFAVREALTVEERVAIGITRFANGTTFSVTGRIFGVGKATAVQCFFDLMKALCGLKDQFIKFPSSNRDCELHIQTFKEYTKCKIPNIIAALDGTLVKIRKPTKNAVDFFCRKQYYAVNTQLCVGANLKILFMATGFAGSMHDSTQFRSTSLCSDLEENIVLRGPLAYLPDGTIYRPLLLGDGAYRLSNYLLKPYSGALNDSKRHYNRILSSARVIVENCNGVLKARWRLLLKMLECEVGNISDYITAACVLHNICQESKEPYDEQEAERIQITEAENTDTADGVQLHLDASNSGTQLREKIRLHLDTIR